MNRMTQMLKDVQANVRKREEAVERVRSATADEIRYKEGERVAVLRIGQPVKVQRHVEGRLAPIPIAAIVSAAPKFIQGMGWRFWVTGGAGALAPNELAWADKDWTPPIWKRRR